MTETPLLLGASLTLPCGAVLPNRTAKAAMTEGLADPMNQATEKLECLYRRWAEGGAGLMFTGNVQVDRRFLERPGNLTIDGNRGFVELASLARADNGDVGSLWIQLNHPGRLTSITLNLEPVAPSAVPVETRPEGYGTPRALSEGEIVDVIERFAHAARTGQEAGFRGVQIHAAHGYLLSQFLSPPLTNRRTDRWGGSLENRAHVVLEVVYAVRRAAGPAFPLSVKLNSSDFQPGGFDQADCIRLGGWLEAAGIDLLEISGGSCEQPRMLGPGARDRPGRST